MILGDLGTRASEKGNVMKEKVFEISLDDWDVNF